jgi:hypothetical protein
VDRSWLAALAALTAALPILANAFHGWVLVAPAVSVGIVTFAAQSFKKSSLMLRYELYLIRSEY